MLQSEHAISFSVKLLYWICHTHTAVLTIIIILISMTEHYFITQYARAKCEWLRERRVSYSASSCCCLIRRRLVGAYPARNVGRGTVVAYIESNNKGNELGISWNNTHSPSPWTQKENPPTTKTCNIQCVTLVILSNSPDTCTHAPIYRDTIE